MYVVVYSEDKDRSEVIGMHENMLEAKRIMHKHFMDAFIADGYDEEDYENAYECGECWDYYGDDAWLYGSRWHLIEVEV